MHIFDISQAKSGTTSLAMALQILGYKTIHGCPENHAADFVARILQNDMKLSLVNAYEAVCGALNFCYYQLDDWYPDARFIYFDRDEDSWVRSTRHQLDANDHSGMTNVNKLTPFTLARLQNLGCLHTDDDVYLRHRFQLRRAEIMAHFENRPEKLLVMQVTDGWQPLCDFLGRPIPNAAFPQLNVS